MFLYDLQVYAIIYSAEGGRRLRSAHERSYDRTFVLITVPAGADRSIEVNKNLIKLTVKLAGRLSSFIYFLDKIFWS